MKNKLKIYVWHTPKIIEYINILKKSAQEFDDVEIISVIGNESVDTNLSMGQTSSDSYKNLMLTRWQSLPDIIKQNIGSNIVWLDADCVLNKNNKIFKKTIEQHLENNDFVFQYDNNSGLCNNINSGVMGIKCTDKTLDIIEKLCYDISKVTHRRDGYPLLEINEMFNKYNDFNLTFSILPVDFCPPHFCEGNDNWGIYHAVGIGDKINALLSKI